MPLAGAEVSSVLRQKSAEEMPAMPASNSTATATAEEMPAVLDTSDMDTMVDEPASDEVEETPTELDTSDMDTMVDEPASDEVAVDPASAETAAETSAGEYNQGVDACIYAYAPATLVETASAVPDFSTLVAALQAADLASAFDDMSQKVTVS